MTQSNDDPRYDAEVEAARSAQQRPDSAEADQQGASGDDALEPQAAAAEKADTPGADAVHEANADGVNPHS